MATQEEERRFSDEELRDMVMKTDAVFTDKPPTKDQIKEAKLAVLFLNNEVARLYRDLDEATERLGQLYAHRVDLDTKIMKLEWERDTIMDGTLPEVVSERQAALKDIADITETVNRLELSYRKDQENGH